MLKKIRSDEKFKDIKPIIVMVTNLGQSDSEEEARKAGADGYIVKANIKPSDLVAVIKSYESVTG